MSWNGPTHSIDDYRQEIPASYRPDMRTSAVIFADSTLMEQVRRDNAPEQLVNVATLPGIVGKAMAMPDIHWGYGFPIGGVAAFSAEDGVISPGGVGYDINCGVRVLLTNLTFKDVKPKVKELVDAIFKNVPSGVGSKGKLRLTPAEMDDVFNRGAEWAIEHGYGYERDLEVMEENGRYGIADAAKVSPAAKKRGMPQLGTLGAGNHFLEIQRVADIFEPEVAEKFGITSPDQIVVMIHTGSRGAGHQIASDYIRIMEGAVRKYGIKLPDKQLACAPVNSPEGQDYLKAMAAGANYAWTNRQLIMHWIRESFHQVMGMEPEDMGMELLYDVAHNIAKVERHDVEGMHGSGGRKEMELVVHRKGATRAFAAGRAEIPEKYRDVGQPILIPGDMGTSSYILVGTETAMKETFGSTCHGAGRVMSRKKATAKFNAGQIKRELADHGIYIRAASTDGIVEEAPGAYKNIDDVIRVVKGAGIARPVARMQPMGVVKG